jgi:hypothetical protein
MIYQPLINYRFMHKDNRKDHPYYIVTPSWDNNSSGVRSLHLLCHALNQAGCLAYIYPDNPDGFATNPLLNTPCILERATHYNYFLKNSSMGVDPIVIYPEKVEGNPLGAKRVVRYLLAPAGAYGGPKTFSDTDMIWGYTTPTAKSGKSDNVLLIPTWDTRMFNNLEERQKSGSCFYSHKYDRIHRNFLLPVTDGMPRVAGSFNRVSELLKTSKHCYVYEMSEVIILAGLCGCPVTLVKTDYFNKIDPELEFDFSHCTWSDGEEVITKAKTFQQIEGDFYIQLYKFIEGTQK